jgi:hypothetical protein
VLGALALGAVARPRSWVFEALAEPALREAGERRPTQEQVRDALHALGQGGWVAQDLRRTGFWSLQPAAVAPAWQACWTPLPPKPCATPWRAATATRCWRWAAMATPACLRWMRRWRASGWRR